jgi:16S rRNA processing protein RimM
LLFLGKITRKHGLKGNVIIKLDTDQPELYNKLEGIFVEVNGLLVPFLLKNNNGEMIILKSLPSKILLNNW